MPTPSILVSTWGDGLFSVTGKRFVKNSPGNRFAVWSPTGAAEYSRLWAGIRSVGDPVRVSGRR
jgi:hypothetical protein